MHRCLVSSIPDEGALLTLSEAEAQHALRVLRMKPGARVQLTDGKGALHWGELMDDGRVKVLHPCEGTEPPIQLTLYQGLPKFDKLELIAQKVTELGVTRIVPVRMSRCVVKLSAADGEKRRERLMRICQEAAKQCGRAQLPEVLAPVDYRDALDLMRMEQLCLMAWEEANGMNLSRMHEQYPSAERIGLVIGPEGGISSQEASSAQQAGAQHLTLGPRILRTETAAIAASAVIMNLWGDL
ncbi:16S rRNA (uracil(1498)-N(3))-methyltransferase [Eubacteriales bacterium OttesenSCG-928-N13]|nr:16S rRNA (uracil(1498)-N(3))-methyltransferase [Eubacteriales bacterium OttesenSCG-928-N13]